MKTHKLIAASRVIIPILLFLLIGCSGVPNLASSQGGPVSKDHCADLVAKEQTSVIQINGAWNCLTSDKQVRVSKYGMHDDQSFFQSNVVLSGKAHGIFKVAMTLQACGPMTSYDANHNQKSFSYHSTGTTIQSDPDNWYVMQLLTNKLDNKVDFIYFFGQLTTGSPSDCSEPSLIPPGTSPTP